MFRGDGPRVLSRPLGVHWAGWQTTTVRLQQCGWDLAVQYEYHHDGYTLLMRHESMQLYAYTDQLLLEKALHDPYYTGENVPVFQVRQVGKTLLGVHAPLDFSTFQQIDAVPRYVEHKIRSIEDFNIFALARSKAEEILVNKADMSVIEHLEAIKRLQEPQQHEIRQRALRERDSAVPARHAPRLHLVAQLVHLEEAA